MYPSINLIEYIQKGRKKKKKKGKLPLVYRMEVKMDTSQKTTKPMWILLRKLSLNQVEMDSDLYPKLGNFLASSKTLSQL